MNPWSNTFPLSGGLNPDTFRMKKQKFISTTVEDPKDFLYLVGFYKDPEKKLTSKGKPVICADILKPYKKVNFFSEDGEMAVKYFTKVEWNGMEYSHGIERVEGANYNITPLTDVEIKGFLNSHICCEGIPSVARGILQGKTIIDPNILEPRLLMRLQAISEIKEISALDFFEIDEILCSL